MSHPAVERGQQAVRDIEQDRGLDLVDAAEAIAEIESFAEASRQALEDDIRQREEAEGS